jgi:hypothetical protein
MRDIAANTTTGDVKKGWDDAADWLEKAAKHYRLQDNA